MALSCDEALDELAAPRLVDRYDTRAKLMALAAQVSITCPGERPGDATLLYSGMLTDHLRANELAVLLSDGSAGPLRVIDSTEAARFLSSPEFRRALLLVEGSFEQTDQVMFDATDGPWAQTSRRFVEAANGPVVTLSAGAADGRVFAQTELPALLRNEAVPSVNGFDRDSLRQAWEAAGGDAAALRPVRAMVDAASAARLQQVRVAVSDDGHLKAADTGTLFEGVPGVGCHPGAKARDWPTVAALSPELAKAQRGRWTEGARGLREGGVRKAVSARPVQVAWIERLRQLVRERGSAFS